MALRHMTSFYILTTQMAAGIYAVLSYPFQLAVFLPEFVAHN